MHTVLQFDYAEVDGLKVTSGAGLGAQRCDNGTWVYDQIMLHLDDGSVLFVDVTQDTDELIVDRIDHVRNLTPYQASSSTPLDDFTGMKFGWCWVGTNWLGYKDVFLLSFAGIEPSLLLVAQASKVNLYRVEPKR